MRVTFPYEEKTSKIFSKVRRPVTQVAFWSKLTNSWLSYKLIIDSGADYTLLPMYQSLELGINPRKDCKTVETSGVGGKVKVFLLKGKAKIKIGDMPMEIPLGFINSNSVPPLLGREGCLNLLKVLLFSFQTELSDR